MRKITYLGISLLVSVFMVSCSSSKMSLKEGATLSRTGQSAPEPQSSNTLVKTDRGLMMTIEADLLFPTNSSYLTDEAKVSLQEFATTLKQYPDAFIQVDGHTDATGTAEYNQWLSEKRAVSVKTYLVSLGVASQRIETTGYGQVKPVASNQTKEGRQKNRRVEITILQ